MTKLINPLSLSESEKEFLATFFKSNLTQTLLWKANTVYTSSDGQDFQLEYPVFWRFQELRDEENKELIRNNKKQPKKNTMSTALKGIRFEVMDKRALGESQESKKSKTPEGVFKILGTLVMSHKDKTLIYKNEHKQLEVSEKRLVKCSVFDSEKYYLIATENQAKGKKYDPIAEKKKGWMDFLERSFNGYENSKKTEHLVVKRQIIDRKEGFCLQISNNEGPDYFNILQDDRILGGKKLSIDQRFKDTINFIAAVRKQITDQGITHRDIKPENMAVDPVTREMTVIDMDHSIKQEYCDGMKVGTIGFRSPESLYPQKFVLQGKPVSQILVTEQTDVYSAGEAVKLIWRGSGFIDYSDNQVMKRFLGMANGFNKFLEETGEFFVTDPQLGKDEASIFSELPAFIKELIKITIKVMLLPNFLQRMTIHEAENLFKDIYQLYKYHAVNPISEKMSLTMVASIIRDYQNVVKTGKQSFRTVRGLVNDAHNTVAQQRKQSDKEVQRHVDNKKVLIKRNEVRTCSHARSKSLFFAKRKSDAPSRKPALCTRVTIAP